jgi:hypothetical protein
MGQRITISESEKNRIKGLYEQAKPSDTQPIQLIQIKVGDNLVDLTMMKKTSQGATFYGQIRGNKEYYQLYFNCGDRRVAMKGYKDSATFPQQQMVSPAALNLLNKASGCDSYVSNQDTSSDMV